MEPAVHHEIRVNGTSTLRRVFVSMPMLVSDGGVVGDERGT